MISAVKASNTTYNTNIFFFFFLVTLCQVFYLITLTLIINNFIDIFQIILVLFLQCENF